MLEMDIPYRQEDNPELRPCEFRSIWKVVANRSYQPVHRDGFAAPGLFLTYDGQGVLEWADGRLELHPGTLCFFPERVPCSYKCDDESWRFYFLEFSSLGMPVQLGLPVGQAVSTGKMPEAVQLCESLIGNLITKPVGHGYASHLLLQQLLLLLAREEASSQAVRDPELDVILFYMHGNIGKPFRVENLLRQTGLSRNALFSRFRALTGKSPSRYMQDLKLASAKASLETTNLSIKEIASALSFYDEFHFSKTFKQRYGHAPSDYRRLLNK